MTLVVSGTSHQLSRDQALRVPVGRPDRSKAPQLLGKFRRLITWRTRYFSDMAQQPTSASGAYSPYPYSERLRGDNAQVWRAICSSSCEGRTCTAQCDLESLIGLFADRFRASSRLTPSQDKPPQIAARVSTSFSPIPPVNTSRSIPPSAAIIAATCLRTE
jgi:hypothetical protein